MPNFDLSFLTPPADHHEHHHPESTAHDLRKFAQEVREAIAAHRPAENAAANQVEVQPGGKVFSTIAEAIASITDASMKKQYVCYIGPGTYNERVICKSWVFLAGSGPDQTIVTAPASPEKTANGTVVGAANSAIQDMSVISTAIGARSNTMAVVCNSIKNFDIENCETTSQDPIGGAIALPISVDYAPGASGSVVNIAYSKATVVAAHAETDALGVFAANYSQVLLTSCNITVNTPGGWGGAATYHSTMTVDSSYVEGAEYSLKTIDTLGTVVANQCTLVGPVSGNVTVNP
jgi:hypothetical protein